MIFHDGDHNGDRTLDVGTSEKSGTARKRYSDHRSAFVAEQRGEDLRLMYVALTRARHQVVAWWGRAHDCRHSPLGRLLIRRDRSTGAVGDAFPGEPTDKDINAALDTLLARTRPGLIDKQKAGEFDPPITALGSPPADRAATSRLQAARFERELDLTWRRASYSSITAAAHLDSAASEYVGSEPEQPGIEDEPAMPSGPGSPGGRAAEAEEDVPGPAVSVVSPLGGVPGGLEVGTFVHAVLERVDFAAPELSVELDAAIQAVQARGSDVDGDFAILGDGLVKALSTPLGPLLPGVCLRDVARKDRLDELDFELPLAGGDSPLGQVSTADLAAVLEEYLPPDGVLAGYPRRLSDPLLETTVRGYLTGSLDLVFRRLFADGLERWFVADYKTNWLGEAGRTLTAWHYRPEALDAEMQRRHYPLQALLYLVALHRYLRWRLPGYSPHTHLGGVMYLFVRGMVGTNTPVVDGQSCGVFSWAPPADLIVDLSELFERGRPGG